jgi:hypothetical protein
VQSPGQWNACFVSSGIIHGCWVCFFLPILYVFNIQVHNFAENTDAVLLVVVAAASSREVATSRALKLARALDSDGKHGPPPHQD